MYHQVAFTDTGAALQSTLDAFLERYGRTTTLHEFLHAEHNNLSTGQLKELVRLDYRTCGASPAFSCSWTPGLRCQCVPFYRANGYLPPPAWNPV